MTRKDSARRAWRGALTLAATAFAGACAGLRPPSATLTVVVHAAPFPSVDSAAVAESAVRWNDGDPSDDDACTESYAAVELRDLLRRCRGMERRQIVVSSTDRLPERGDVIVLGNPRSQPLVDRLLSGARPDSASADAFRIRALGQGGRTVWVVAGSSRTGTLYGTYALLERLGLRFYGPAAEETVWPRDPVELPRRIDLASSPAYDVRGFWAWQPRGNPAFFRWMARRRMNLWTDAEPTVPLLRKLGIRLIGGGHTIQADYLNPRGHAPGDRRTYFETHPEWFGLHAGGRSPKIDGESGDNFCTSNDAAVAELAHNLIRSLREGPLKNADIVNLWPLDQGRWCECEACRAIGGPTDRELNLAWRLATAVREARRRGELNRGVVLAASAYFETTSPPTRPLPVTADDRDFVVTFFPYFRCYAHALSDPSCTEMNQTLEAAWNGWARDPWRPYRGPMGVGEYYNVSWNKSLPLVFPHVMARDIAEYHAAGARSFYYMHVPTARWGSWRLNHLVLSQALWSPGGDVDSLIADYCARAFPKESADMKAFYAALETASANIFTVELTVGGVMGVAGHPEGRLAVRGQRLFPFTHLGYAPAPRALNAAPAWTEIMAAMAAARRSLDRARAAARDSAERARIDDEAERFAYGELTFALYDRMLKLSSVYRGSPAFDAATALAEADSLAGRLRAIRDLVQVAGLHADAADGLEASHVAPALAFFHAYFAGAKGDAAPRRR